MNIRQAITTKYFGPTNFKGSRVKAICACGSTTIAWDDALNSDENHRAAADALVAEFVKGDTARYGTHKNPWSAPRAQGVTADGNHVHVFID